MLREKPEADMDLVAAESTFNAMEAFYKVYHWNSCYECVLIILDSRFLWNSSSIMCQIWWFKELSLPNWHLCFVLSLSLRWSPTSWRRLQRSQKKKALMSRNKRKAQGLRSWQHPLQTICSSCDFKLVIVRALPLWPLPLTHVVRVSQGSPTIRQRQLLSAL